MQSSEVYARDAETCLEYARKAWGGAIDVNLMRAQVYATLALAAATKESKEQ